MGAHNKVGGLDVAVDKTIRVNEFGAKELKIAKNVCQPRIVTA